MALVAAPAGAQTLRLAPVFSDHMVVQRDKPMPVEGHAAPGAEVSAQFGDAPAVAGRADAEGRWRIELPAHGPLTSTTLTVRSGGETARLVDVAVGDVFLCSGQSNMEFTLRVATNADGAVGASTNPALRLFNVPRQSSPTPQAQFASPVTWQPSAPTSARDFSAACWFMGAELQRVRKVPVGLIAASWGGSIIQDWLSEAGLRRNGGFDEGLAMLALRGTDPAAAQRWLDKELDRYFKHATAKLEAPIPADPNRLWEEWGASDLASFDGAGVYISEVTLTADQARRARRIHLGAVDDFDQTLVNGAVIGSTTGWTSQRTYSLASDQLRAGVNHIQVRVIDTGGGGGMWGTAPRRLELDDGSSVPLDGRWQFQRGADIRDAGPAPSVPWIGASGLTTLYNGMIAPLGRIPLAGIAWYQGEANVGDPAGYAKLLPSLIADWRERFSTRRFALVQLANFGPMQSRPVDSAWAALRDVQRATVAADRDTGMAVAIDIGDPRDIHPTNKKDVGLRLALAMEGASNAQLPEVARAGGQVRLRFDRPLKVIGDAVPIGFEACSAKACRFTAARIADPATILVDAAPGDTKVRYLWADSPIANLYDRDGLPVTPFEVGLP
ncbi:sialate O-acetylesterase [Sphingomonas sp. MS122]|uniref:sialate O-acetylesterase n=1 Tax=Sphingomonas sp. MS122 TaxID=3412683 RepID=UPI003C2FF32B